MAEHGGRPEVLSGLATDDDWFDFQVESDPRFLKRIEESRSSLRAGLGVSWDRVKREDDQRAIAPGMPAWPGRSTP